MFSDRTAAGERLAEELLERDIDADVVLAIPPGGVPLGRAVADRLGAPLDVVAAKKIALPDDPEYAIGAVSSREVVWYDSDVIRQLDIDENDIAERRAQAAKEAKAEAATLRDDRAAVDLEAKHVLIVDDGIATGAAMRACARTARAEGATEVTIAVPVSAPTSVPELRLEADDVVVLEAPERFRAVGQAYQSFDRLAADDATEYLEGAATAD